MLFKTDANRRNDQLAFDDISFLLQRLTCKLKFEIVLRHRGTKDISQHDFVAVSMRCVFGLCILCLRLKNKDIQILDYNDYSSA